MDAEDVVVAKRFVLVDDEGNPRAALLAQRDGIVGLYVGTEEDDPLISIGMDAQEGTPYVMVRRTAADGTGRGAVMLSVSSEGVAAVHLEDVDGSSRTYTT